MLIVHPRRAIALCALAVLTLALAPSVAPAASRAPSAFPRYGHVFLIVMENHNYDQIIGNPAAPEINALARDYGLATSYQGVADPSEPNYVAMLGGSTFGVSSDDPYFFPGDTVNQPNLMSQLDGGGYSWRGYFQGMPYAGYRGYCFPAKCNGIPDSDTQYVAKHNGIVNFADMHSPREFAKQKPYARLASDLTSGSLANLSYIVPDECDDMHGAPPWCVDSGNPGDVDDTWLVAQGDAFVGRTVNEITSSPVWKHGNDAIVVTFDEGNFATDRIPTIVITNHGPRGLRDHTQYNHYSLLASLEQAFGRGCLRGSCHATPMTPLFAPSGSTSTPALPPPFVPTPDGRDTVSPIGEPVGGKVVILPPDGGWSVVPSPHLSALDNNLAAVSAGSANDAWAVGDYYDPSNPNVLRNLGERWNGSSWTAYALPDVGPNENTLLGVSERGTGRAWAVGYYINAEYQQRTLIEYWNGSGWFVAPAPNPGAAGDILYGVSAIAADDVWAVGAQEDATGIWHPLTVHFNGRRWSVVSAPDPSGGGNLLYAVAGSGADNVYAVGQTGTSFPSRALVEHWDGSRWSLVTGPVDPTHSLDPFGVTVTDSSLTTVGARESDVRPFTALVAAGSAAGLKLADAPNAGTGETDLFAAATATDASTWAVGWAIDPSSGNHQTLAEHGVNGAWSVVPSPSPSGDGDNGLAGISAIPGGSLWAVGITTNAAGNPAPLIEYHP